MTTDEFENWLGQHQEYWRSADDDIWPELQPNETVLTLPESYREFQQRFGALTLYRYLLLDAKGTADRTAFVRSLSKPNEGANHDHLIAFCCQSSSHNYLCFDGEQVVDFNPLEAKDPAHLVAPSFPVFLNELLKHNGENFWVTRDHSSS